MVKNTNQNDKQVSLAVINAHVGHTDTDFSNTAEFDMNCLKNKLTITHCIGSLLQHRLHDLYILYILSSKASKI